MMARLFRRSGKKVGSSPGTLLHVGERKAESVRITVMDYDEGECREREVSGLGDCVVYKGTSSTTWINIDGLHEVGIIEEAGKAFELHPLVLEDVLNTQHQPKVEEFDDYIFAVMKMLTYDEEACRVRAEQISLVLGEGYLLSFQESVGDIFGPVRKRIKTGRVRIR